MKFIILLLLMAIYVVMTISIQEGMVTTTNLKVTVLRSTEDWDNIKPQLQTFLEDTSSARYILMYPSGENINDSIDYLEGIGENAETDSKMLLYVWAPLDEAVSAELVDILGIDSVPTPFTKGLFTFDADSEAVTETDYNIMIASTLSGKTVKKGGVAEKTGKKISKGAKDAMDKTDKGARKFFGMKKKK